MNKVLKLINVWFNANLLSLNIGKTYFIQFSTKNISLTNFNITYDNKVISDISNMKFLGIKIANANLYKSHIDMTVHKLSAAWLAAGTVKLFMFLETQKIIYYAYFHSIMNYAIIGGGGEWKFLIVILFLSCKRRQNYNGCQNSRFLWGIFQEIKYFAITVTVYTLTCTLCN